MTIIGNCTTTQLYPTEHADRLAQARAMLDKALAYVKDAVTPLKAPPLVKSAWGRDFYIAHNGNPAQLDALIRQGSQRMSA